MHFLIIWLKIFDKWFLGELSKKKDKIKNKKLLFKAAEKLRKKT